MENYHHFCKLYFAKPTFCIYIHPCKTHKKEARRPLIIEKSKLLISSFGF